MNTYSIVHTYREHYTGKVCHTSIQGMTYATIDAAFERIMRALKDYKPGDKRFLMYVWENYYPIDVAYEAMGRQQRKIFDEVNG